MTAVNGANAKCMSRITHKDIHTEAIEGTRSYDLVWAIIHMRLKWLGHILRMSGDRLVKVAAKVVDMALLLALTNQEIRIPSPACRSAVCNIATRILASL